MKFSAMLAVAFALATGAAAHLRSTVQRQPLYDGKVDSDANFATSADATKPGRAPGYRNAWDDCGGVGASATERMRTIAAKIKGWAKPLPFVRSAAQDCGKKTTGTEPGPGSGIVYPGPEIWTAAREGLSTASDTLAKYPAGSM